MSPPMPVLEGSVMLSPAAEGVVSHEIERLESLSESYQLLQQHPEEVLVRGT